MAKLGKRPPDRLVNAQRVRVLNERGKEKIQRFLRMSALREVAREGEPRTPILRILFDEPPAETGKPFRIAGSLRQRVEAVEGQVGAIRRELNEALPDPRRFLFISLRHVDVAKIQIRRHDARAGCHVGDADPYLARRAADRHRRARLRRAVVVRLLRRGQDARDLHRGVERVQLQQLVGRVGDHGDDEANRPKRDRIQDEGRCAKA